MYKCKICDKEYEIRHAYIAHSRVHSGYIRPKKENSRRNRKEKLICPYCNLCFVSGKVLGGHITHCKSNPKFNEIRQNMTKSSRARNFSHTNETKKRISETRIKYLIEHPDKVPYKMNHSSKMSYPEIIFKNALETAHISGWTYNYQHGIYSYDFAFPDLKIDVEIDGNTHTQEKVKKIDERRDKFSTEMGWIVIRFTAKEVKLNIIKCVDVLIRKIKYIENQLNRF